MKLLSIIILTLNEELNLPFCLESLKAINADVFVIDSGSMDKTVSIAQNAGCHVVSHSWEGYHARQFNWGLDNLPIKTPWVMKMDADEWLTPSLVDSLKDTLPNAPENVSGYDIKRRIYFMGRWLRHGGLYPVWGTRIWRYGLGRLEEKWMDEQTTISKGMIARIESDYVDENRNGIDFFIQKHLRYANNEVKEISQIALKGNTKANENLNMFVKRIRWMKENCYLRMPLFFRCFLYWFYRYIILLGFLDGQEGLIFHFLQGFWYRFLVDVKLFEMKKKNVKKDI